MLIVVRISFYLVVALGLSGGGSHLQAQHIHINAGAVSQTQNSQLRFANSAVYNTNSNVGGSSPATPACFFMSDNYPELYGGLYQAEVSFTSLPATLWTGGPAPGAAAQGAYLEVKMYSVSGPAGGEISFWEENEEATESVRRFKIPVGTSNGTNRFNLSEGYDTPYGPDPFGHIHGRRFTANKSGLYVVGMQVLDTSTAGTGGGPIHQPSALTNYFYFQAGVYLNSIIKTNNSVTVQYGVRSFYDYYLDVTTNLATTNWVTIATNIVAVGPDNIPHSDLHYITDNNATNASRFYRLREVPH